MTKSQQLSRERLRGIRKMFDLYTEKVDIVDRNGTKNTYELSPLTGEHLENLYYVIEKFQGNETDKESDILKVLGTDVTKKLHGLVVASLQANYGDVDVKKLDQFVSQNLMKFVEPLIKVNVPQD
jgi:hypothetical protein